MVCDDVGLIIVVLLSTGNECMIMCSAVAELVCYRDMQMKQY